MNYLITGGLGFIGQELAKQVIQNGDKAFIVDNLSPQIHKWPANNFIGSSIKICDFVEVDLYRDFIINCDHFVHLAAETGTGQSMYEIVRYTNQNVQKLSVLLEYLALEKPNKLKSLVLASSRSVYGEGSYHCNTHGKIFAPERLFQDLKSRIYDPTCPICKSPLQSIPTGENDMVNPASIYATSKLTQEFLVKNFAVSQGIPATVFRFQNVYGEGQSLYNPYTGILAIFSNLARSNAAIRVFEDGRESRDFVHVSDVVRSLLQVLGKHQGYELLNIGSGIATDVLTVANLIVNKLGSMSKINVTHEYRKGDIRHNTADLSKLGFYVDHSNFLTFEQGLDRFLEWATTQETGNIRDFSRSLDELNEKGLLVTNE